MRAQTEVLADAEAEVRVRVAVDAERVRRLEYVLVAVGGGIEEQQPIARAYLLAGQLRVARRRPHHVVDRRRPAHDLLDRVSDTPDRKSTRLNSSHLGISYAVFCLKKKK